MGKGQAGRVEWVGVWLGAVVRVVGGWGGGGGSCGGGLVKTVWV